jgi:hypothetical protein
MSKLIALAAIGISLAGCNTVAEAWKRPGSSADQTNRSFDECRYQANFARGPRDQEEPRHSYLRARLLRQ